MHNEFGRNSLTRGQVTSSTHDKLLVLFLSFAELLNCVLQQVQFFIGVLKGLAIFGKYVQKNFSPCKNFQENRRTYMYLVVSLAVLDVTHIEN